MTRFVDWLLPRARILRWIAAGYTTNDFEYIELLKKTSALSKNKTFSSNKR